VQREWLAKLFACLFPRIAVLLLIEEVTVTALTMSGRRHHHRALTVLAIEIDLQARNRVD
jgi:hypothetical protein